MDKSKVIKKLEEIIETVKDENNYIVNVWERENADIEKVTAHGEGEVHVLGLKEVGKNIDIDIDIEYVVEKRIELEEK